MLVSFEVEGVYSFGKRLRVDFGAKTNSRLKNTKYEDNFCLESKIKTMKSAIFFGANATGKTNLFLAISLLSDIAYSGLEQTLNKRKNIFYQGRERAFLAMELIDDRDNLYRYEIEFDLNGVVIQEALLKNKKSLFVYQDKKLQSAILQKDNFEQFQQVFPNTDIKESVHKLLKNFLKQKEFVGFTVEVLKLVFHPKISYSKNEDTFFREDNKNFIESHQEKMIGLLNTVDPSISDFRFQEYMEKDEVRYKFVLKRNDMEFEYQQESEGVKKILRLAEWILMIVEHGVILIVDELDSSISTLALIELLNSFINTSENKKGQLIITSHNLLLFDVSFLNSQQIFLVQKDAELCTQIKTYYEYDIRSEKKQAYLSYLRGEYDGD